MTYRFAELVPQQLATRAREAPDGIALQQVDGAALTWGDGYRQALEWADALERVGVRAGEPVVTLFANGFDSFRSWFGCSWLRAIESPVNTAYKGEWLRHVINNTGTALVLADARFVQPVFDIADTLPNVRRVVVFGDVPSLPDGLPFEVLSAAAFLDGAVAREREEPAPWDIANLIYTSGTTGRSKAVKVPWGQNHAALLSGFFPLEHLDAPVYYSYSRRFT